MVLAAGLGTSMANAAVFSDVNLGGAGPAGLNLVVFVTGGTVFSASNSGTLFNGNVGLGPGSSTNVSGGGTISGNLYKDPSATLQANFNMQFSVNGSIITQNLGASVTDVQNASLAAQMLSPDQTFGSVGGSALGINATGALNGMGGRNTVVDIHDISITNSTHNLTINGGANDFFIINVGGSGQNGTVINVTNGAILLSGGISESHVLWNIIPQGDVVLTNASSTLTGTFLAPFAGQQISLSPGTVYGAIYGYTIQTSSGPHVNSAPYTGVPSPAPAALLGLGGLLAARRRRR
jgi:MYXO-CTERM domain-containing protein